MPDIKLRNQPFDLKFHPSEPVVFAGLLTGEVKAFRYDDQTGEASSSWSVRPTKKTMRSVDVSTDGSQLWTGGKAGTLFQLDPAVGTVVKERDPAHDAPVNRVFCVNEQLIASGDDEGVIRFWDPRQEDAVRAYTHHFDYISDFSYFEDKKQLVTTSGDGHLSVIDVRVNKTTPMSVSDDQEDELLSIAQIKGGSKAVIGSTLGVLSIWNRAKGWQDSVDRIPGHPASVDALVALSPDIIATGSEDGMIRVMQILPHKFLGVIATHEEYPIERMKLDRNGKWLGSVSHDDCIKLTDVEDLFEDSEDEGNEDADDDDDEDEDEDMKDGADDDDDGHHGDELETEEEGYFDSDSDLPSLEKKTKKSGKGGLGDMGRASRNNDTSSFFDDL